MTTFLNYPDQHPPTPSHAALNQGDCGLKQPVCPPSTCRPLLDADRDLEAQPQPHQEHQCLANCWQDEPSHTKRCLVACWQECRNS